MKLLILTCLLAVSWAAPLAKPDDDNDKGKGPDFRSGSYVTHSGVPHSVFTGYQPVSYAAHGPVSFAPGSQVFQAVHPSGVAYSSGAHFGAVGVAKYESGEVESVAVHGAPVAYASGASFVPTGQVSYSVQQAAGPTVTTYNAGHAVVPAQATQFVAAAPAVAVAHATPAQYHTAVEGASAVATVQHSAPVQYHGTVEVAPAFATVQHSAPVQYHAAVEVAPAFATVQHTAPVQYHHAQVAAVEVAPAVATVQHHTVQQAAVAAVPTAITYQSEHTVELPSKEINVPVQNTYVYRPVEKRVNYKTENYVAGSTTTIHKPKISAPAIAAPQVFKTKVQHAAPEVTVHHSEVTVEKNSPNYVDAPYDAGVVVEQAAPEINQVDVPTPVEVPHPVAVPTPYHVKVAQPIKVKSSISPVVNVDVHSVQTENVVTPVEYTAHHHVATAPVVAQAVPVATPGHYVAQAPQAVVYGAAVPTGQVAAYGAGQTVVLDAGQAAAAGAGQVVTYGAGQATAHGAGHLVTFDAGQATAHGAGQTVVFDAGQAATHSAGHLVTFDAGQAAAHGAGQTVVFDAGQAATHGAGHFTHGAGHLVTFDAGQAATHGAGHFTHGAGHLVTFDAGQAAASGAGQVVTYGAGQAGSSSGVVSGVHGFNQFGVGVPTGYAGNQQFTFTGVPSGAVFTETQEGAGQFVQGNFGQFVYPQQVGGHSFSAVGTPTVTTYSAGNGPLKDSFQLSSKTGTVEGSKGAEKSS